MRALIVLVTALGVATPASAFHNETDFPRPGIAGGGGGNYFTGSPRSRGWDCAVCHIDEARQVYFTVASEPAGLIAKGSYEPGTTYTLTVQMQGEHRGVGGRLNRNMFLAEFVDDDGESAGTLGNPSQWAVEIVEDEVIGARGASSDETEWSFQWLAPLPGEERPVTMYLAGVDGDGASGELAPNGDPFNDDVYSGLVELLPPGVFPDQRTPAAGCSGSGAPVGSLLPTLGMLALLLLWRRRSSLFAVALLGLLFVACGGDDAPAAVDCRRTICAPDSGEEQDAASAPDARGSTDAATPPRDASDAVDGDIASSDGGGPVDRCRGTDVMIEGDVAFCEDSCYCRLPEMCLPISAGEDCCRDTVACPVGEPFVGCRAWPTIRAGDRIACEHGRCFCATDNHCYAGPVADACCEAPVHCF